AAAPAGAPTGPAVVGVARAPAGRPSLAEVFEEASQFGDLDPDRRVTGKEQRHSVRFGPDRQQFEDAVAVVQVDAARPDRSDALEPQSAVDALVRRTGIALLPKCGIALGL